MQFAVGEEIEGRYGGQGSWFAGKVAAVHASGKFDLVYDDGDTVAKFKHAIIVNKKFPVCSL